MDKEETKKDGKRLRKPFTPGWVDHLEGEEALPIKRGNRVIKVKKQSVQPSNADEEEAEVVIHDDEAEENAKKAEDAKKAQSSRPKAAQAAPVKPLALADYSASEEIAMKQRIADICTAITSNPETAVLRKQLVADGSDDYGIKDLLQLCASRDVQELELALLSTSLVFKDICPSYRIRSDNQDEEGDKQMKKETKRLRDFELSLLKVYQRFLKILEDLVTSGLGSPKHAPPPPSLARQVAMVALRCQCELLLGLHHFNFRSNLLSALVGRAAQHFEEGTNLCCATLEEVVNLDVHCDLSFELVSTVSKVLTTAKFDIPERLLRVLQAVKLTVHEDKVKALQIKVKSDRKKRKRNQDSVEAMMLEANVEADKLQRQRYQGNSLQEIALIYFRVLKAKVGFGLLPAALEGLGKITHLINLDTVHDLLTNLRHLLALEPKPPVEVRLLCVHCALQTLTGPGEELKVDLEPYVAHLLAILKEIPWTFTYWPALIEALEMVLIKKRLENAERVQLIVRLLLIHTCHRLEDIGAIILSFLHNILLRYPRIRSAAQENWRLDARATTTDGRWTVTEEEEEKVEDLAMQGLRDGSATAKTPPGHISEQDELGNGSLALALIQGYPDPKYKRMVEIVLSKDIAPLPYRASDADPNHRLAAPEASSGSDAKGPNGRGPSGRAGPGRGKGGRGKHHAQKNGPRAHPGRQQGHKAAHSNPKNHHKKRRVE